MVTREHAHLHTVINGIHSTALEETAADLMEQPEDQFPPETTCAGKKYVYAKLKTKLKLKIMKFLTLTE